MTDKESRFKFTIFLGIILLLGLGTGVGFIFVYLGIPIINALLVYVLAIAVVAVRTYGKLYTMITAIMAVLCFNYFFAEPAFSLVAEPGYLITFLVIVVLAYILAITSTSKKKAEKERYRIEEEAKREAFQVNILRAISHDLRTPLAGISGNANILLSHGDSLSDETKQQIYEAIEDDSLWLNNLVENLLSISRMHADSSMVADQPELVVELVEHALSHIDRRAVNYNICNCCENEFLMVKADSRLIVQVIINIVNNAIKYTPEGSDINIYSEEKGEMIEIRIEDNGPGMTDKALEKAFEQFYSEGKLKSDDRRGLGLGLFLCRMIVEAHGGEIVAYNCKPTGAGFAFTLPKAELSTETIG